MEISMSFDLASVGDISSFTIPKITKQMSAGSSQSRLVASQSFFENNHRRANMQYGNAAVRGAILS